MGIVSASHGSTPGRSDHHTLLAHVGLVADYEVEAAGTWDYTSSLLLFHGTGLARK